MLKDLIRKVNPEHIGLLTAALRSPSAHNAQPWKIKPLPGGHSYEIHYDHNDYLPEDPDDRDAYLTMGAFIETLALEASNFGLKVDVDLKLERSGDDLYIAEVLIEKAAPGSEVDPLSKFISKRVTNRNPYSKEPLSLELEAELKKLGNILIEPRLLKEVVTEASMKSWNNPRFVRDLYVWYRKDLTAPDGFTGPQMRFDILDTLALRFAFWRGQLKSKFVEKLYSTRDVAMFIAAPKAAVLAANEMSPGSLLDAGRRLLRSWVAIAGAGYSCHPFSIAIDEKSTALKVAELTGVPVPVALYRIGKATKQPYGSNRKKLEDVLIN